MTRLIQSVSSARFYFELSGKSNYCMNLIVISSDLYGWFTPKLNLQPSGFRLASNWLQTSFRLVNAVGLHWCSMVPLTAILESEARLKPFGCDFNLL